MRRSATRCLAPVVIGAALVTGSCGGAQEKTPGRSASPEPAASIADAPEAAAPAQRDLSGIDVCGELPAATLAFALGVRVAQEARFLEDDPDPNCSYRFEGAGGESRVDVYLRDGSDYDWALQTAKNFDREVIEVAGIGEAAYRKTTLDGWWEVWARRPDGSAVQTAAREVELAEGAAAAALREIF